MNNKKIRKVCILTIILLLFLSSICFFAGCSKINYTFIFHTDSEQNIPNIVKNGEDFSKFVLPEPNREGYKFLGWFLDEECTNAFESSKLDKKMVNVNVYAKWELESYKVEVTSNLLNSVSLTGGQVNQNVACNVNFQPIHITPNLGYKYLYYEINGEKFFDDTIQLPTVEQDTTINIVSDYATYELPIININTNGVPILNKIDYVDMEFSIQNCDNELIGKTGGIRFRGNSTMAYDKKPYRIKFDKKQSLFGLEEAKSWVLLADYLDPSCLHNYVALSLGNEFDGLAFTPTPNKVNMYFNGEFVGLYTLCEQVQENKGRINIEQKITADMVHLKDFNFFISMDESVISDSDSVLDETYFYLEDYDKYIELKYPEKSDFVSVEQFNTFFTELKEYVQNLFDKFNSYDLEFINQEVNVNSLIDYFIVDSIMMEWDHGRKSFNMYYTTTSKNEAENNKLNFGPIWDYDWCLNTPWTNEPNTYYELNNDIFYSNIFFQAIENLPTLLNVVKTNYTNYASDKLGELIDSLLEMEEAINESLELNSIKWYSGTDIMQNNILFLNNFLVNRKNILDSLWLIND